MTRSALIVFLSSVTITCSLQAAPLHDLNTRHYTIHTDLDSQLTADLGHRLDAMYEEYDQRLSVFRSSAPLPRFEVYLFSSARDYTTFTEGRLQNSGGAFIPGKNQLAAYLGDQGRDQLRRTLQHEAFHQFAFNAIGKDLPAWLNEGLAQYFEEGLWNGDGFLLGEVPPRRIRQLQADLKSGRLIDLSSLSRLSNDAWTARLAFSRADGVTQYNQSWAIVHFLVMSRNSRGEYLYRSRLVDMLRELHAGQSGEKAFALAFGHDLGAFQQRFSEYARSLKPTAEASMIENQGVLADLLVDFDREGHRFKDIGSLRKFVNRGRYHLHYSRGDLSWDTDPDMNVYFSHLNGKLFGTEDLYLSSRPGAPLADVVCRYGNRLTLRTRFHEGDNHVIDHELVIEPANASVSVSN